MKTVFFTAHTSVYTLRAKVPGLPGASLPALRFTTRHESTERSRNRTPAEPVSVLSVAPWLKKCCEAAGPACEPRSTAFGLPRGGGR